LFDFRSVESNELKMKVIESTIIALIFVGFVESKRFSDQQTATAIVEIAENIFYERSITFDIITYRNSLRKLVNEVAKSLQKGTAIVNIDNSPGSLAINQSAILFFDNVNHFNAFYKKADLANDYPKDLYFLVYIGNLKRRKSHFPKPIYALNPHKPFRFFYVLVDYKGEDYIELETLVTFQQPDCREFKNQTVNRFSKVSKKWESRQFEIKKFRNLNGCELIVGRNVLFEYYIEETHKFMEQVLNFTSKWVIFDTFKQIFTTEVLNEDFLLMSQQMRMSAKENRQYDEKNTMTHYVAVSDQIIIVSRSVPYTMFEKAVLPLDDDVWYWLLGFVGVGVVVIVVLSFMKRSIRHFVIGASVSAPLLNLL
jgi:hypothetical protein